MVAPDMSVLLKVEELPETERGSELRFAPKAPPDCTDSAASESEATAPVPSCIGSLNRSGAEVFCTYVLGEHK